MSNLLQLVRVLGPKFAQLLPLLLSLISLIKSGATMPQIIDVVTQIVAIFNPPPTGGPAMAAGPADEATFVSEAVAAGCTKADAEKLAAAVK